MAIRENSRRSKAIFEGPSLARVLRYRNARVTTKFSERYNLPRREVETLFQDMLRVLWLSARGTVMILPCQMLIDEMWHAFILHTEDYARFCTTYFGAMIHHRPTHKPAKSKGAASRGRAAVEARKARDMRMLRRQIGFVYDELGSEIAHRWYDVYTKRYTGEFLDAHSVSHTKRVGH